MKNILHEWGIISSTRLTRPLREFGQEEITALKQRLQPLPHGAERIAVAV
jgi:hypothetical protein